MMTLSAHRELGTARPSKLGPSVIQLGESGSSTSGIGLEQVQGGTGKLHKQKPKFPYYPPQLHQILYLCSYLVS